jgi:hypothetical protein
MSNAEQVSLNSAERIIMAAVMDEAPGSTGMAKVAVPVFGTVPSSTQVRSTGAFS